MADLCPPVSASFACQLLGFRDKIRNDPGAAPKQAVAAGLTDRQIIDAAAYVGSSRPWGRADIPTGSAMK